MKFCFLIASIISSLGFGFASATSLAPKLSCSDTTAIDSAKQKDVMDILHSIFKKKGSIDTNKVVKKINASILPTAGYTLSTGFIVGVTGVATFFTVRDHRGNESVINAQALYNSHGQQIFMIQSNIFTASDQFKFVTDLRANKYPDVTYGLGNRTTAAAADNIIYNYLRFYQTALKKITPNIYVGGGYCLDYHYNIIEDETSNNRISAFDRYVKTASSHSSGFNLTALFDSRSNPVNPLEGEYANVFYRDNLKFLGSDSRWSSIQIDLRKYFKLSSHSNNVLAIWSYTWLTIKGKQPYLDLPSLGNDTYNNTGRGYVIDRFRGKNMFYLEGEYRFGITRNGLLGGVVFANLQSYPRSVNAYVRSLIPAAGSGIRIKINKRANINLAIDYGVGVDGSHGLFVNLGEVF